MLAKIKSDYHDEITKLKNFKSSDEDHRKIYDKVFYEILIHDIQVYLFSQKKNSVLSKGFFEIISYKKQIFSTAIVKDIFSQLNPSDCYYILEEHSELVGVLLDGAGSSHIGNDLLGYLTRACEQIEDFDNILLTKDIIKTTLTNYYYICRDKKEITQELQGWHSFIIGYIEKNENLQNKIFAQPLHISLFLILSLYGQKKAINLLGNLSTKINTLSFASLSNILTKCPDIYILSLNLMLRNNLSGKEIALRITQNLLDNNDDFVRNIVFLRSKLIIDSILFLVIDGKHDLCLDLIDKVGFEYFAKNCSLSPVSMKLINKYLDLDLPFEKMQQLEKILLAVMNQSDQTFPKNKGVLLQKKYFCAQLSERIACDNSSIKVRL